MVITGQPGQVIEGFGGAFTESSAAVYGTGGTWVERSAVSLTRSKKLLVATGLRSKKLLGIA